MVTVCNGVLQNLTVKDLNNLKIYHCMRKNKNLTCFKMFFHYLSFMILFLLYFLKFRIWMNYNKLYDNLFSKFFILFKISELVFFFQNL